MSHDSWAWDISINQDQFLESSSWELKIDEEQWTLAVIDSRNEIIGRWKLDQSFYMSHKYNMSSMRWLIIQFIYLCRH